MRAAIGLLLPPACLGCGAHLGLEDPGRRLCIRCSTSLRPPPHPRCPRCSAPIPTGGRHLPCLECAGWPEELARAEASVLLEGPAVRLVHGLKYGGWKVVGQVMATRMAHLIPVGGGLIVPIPTTSKRKRLRGYNQAEVIARNLSSMNHIECVDAMIRSPSDTTQVALQRTEREANVRRAFSIRAGAIRRVRGAHVVVVDDVLTTGATAGAAAVTLGRAGAARVDVVTFARTLPDEARPLSP
jgi:ComF family protein